MLPASSPNGTYPASPKPVRIIESQAMPPMPYLSTSPGNTMPIPSSSEDVPFTPKRVMASFDNLVALANHQERLREARKMVWRDRGQPVVELVTLKACLEHAAAGGFRSGVLAFNIRACVNLVLVLIRIRNVPRDVRFSIVRHAVFGLDSWRFAAMFGTFTSIYKFLINALPIMIPAMNPPDPTHGYLNGADPGTAPVVELSLHKSSARLSLSAHAQLALIRKKTRRWHAALAGSLAGGLAIMWEKRTRRSIIAQQLFVRGLQGSYNFFSEKHNIHVPHGAVLVFSLVCGQIMYAFFLRPDTLPRSYSSWIAHASKVSNECIRMNYSLARERTLDVADLDRIAGRSNITPPNLSSLLSLRSLLLTGSPASPASPAPSYHYPSLPYYAPCYSVHPAFTSCVPVPFDRFYTVFKWMLPIYGALHFIPAVLFKGKSFMLDPRKILTRAGLGTLRSSAFLGVFVVIYQTLFCYKHYLHRVLTAPGTTTRLPRFIVDLLVSRASYYALGFSSGLSLFVEERRRRGELAMYVLPRGLESLWAMLRGKGLVFKTGNWGEMALTALGMGMVMSTYQNDPQHLSGFVRRILYQFIGPN